MPNPPPFIIRLFQPTDFHPVLDLIQAASQADGLHERQTADALRARVSSPHDDPRLSAEDDMWVVVVREAGVVAYGDGVLRGQGGYRTECFVHPSFRGRGIGRALLTRQCQRAQAIARMLAAPGAPLTVTLGARAWEQQAAALAVLEAKGLRRERTFLELARDLAQPVAASPVPPGLRLEPWLDRRADEAIWQADVEAFADHWNYSSETFESFMSRLTLGRIQGEHCLIAWAGSTVAGASLNDMDGAHTGRAAWISHLFVRRAWRGRGLGRALVNGSLARARQLGFATAELLVDAENAAGALQLYRAAGFEEVARRYSYQMLFTAGIDAEPTH